MNDHSDDKTRKKGMGKSINKHIRIDENLWRRIEKAAHERGITPVRLMISAALKAVEEREWPRTQAEPHLLRSAMFAAQVMTSYMERAGNEGKHRRLAEISHKSYRNCRIKLPVVSEARRANIHSEGILELLS